MFKKIVRAFAAASFLISATYPSCAELLTVRVSSVSMLPILGKGDLFAATSYGAHEEIKRGDIVVYKVHFTEKLFTKEYVIDDAFTGRVIGLPGETIGIKGGIPIVNGAALQSQKLKDTIEDGCEVIPNTTLPCHFVRETLPDRTSYVVLNQRDDSLGDNVKPKTLGPNEYYIMGDNRDNSNDSRFPAVGLVSIDRIKGKLRMIYATVRAPDRNERLQGFPNLK